MKKKNVWKKVKSPLEKFGMLGKEEGVTRVKDLLWKWEKEDADLVRMAEVSLKDIWDRYSKGRKVRKDGKI